MLRWGNHSWRLDKYLDNARSLALGRGVRMDEAKQGHGLGLAIVREIVDAYSGRFELDQSNALGGLKVLVCFPPPKAD